MAKLNNANLTNVSEYPNSFKRQNHFPLDATEVFYSFSSAQEYAKTNGTAYVGQKIIVFDNHTVKLLVIADEAGGLVEVGSTSFKQSNKTTTYILGMGYDGGTAENAENI